MADWKIVRFDPTYGEPIDPEIIPLCDALQAAGFNTIVSCWGHGQDWPRVWWDSSSTDAVCESLARFLMKRAGGDYRPFFPLVQKEILADGHSWCLEIHLNDVYFDTPQVKLCELGRAALGQTTLHVGEWAAMTGSKPRVDG